MTRGKGRLYLSYLILFPLVLLCTSFTFAPITRISHFRGSSFLPSVAAYENMVHIVWNDMYYYGDYKEPNIYYTRSLDNGDSWEVPKNLNNEPEAKNYGAFVCADKYGVYVAWQKLLGKLEESDIFFTRSLDFGTTFEPSTRLTDCKGFSRLTDLQSINNTLFILWYDNRYDTTQVYLKKSYDHGASFTPDIVISDVSISVDNEFPIICPAGENKLALFYRTNIAGLPQGGFSPAQLSRYLSMDNGYSWTAKPQIINYPLPSIYMDVMGLSGTQSPDGTIHLAFAAFSSGYNIYYCQSRDGGLSWGERKKLTSYPNIHHPPQGVEFYSPSIVAGDNQEVYIFWSTMDRLYPDPNQTYGNLYGIASYDNGNSWRDMTVIVSNSNAQKPRAVKGNKRIHLVWSEYLESYGGDEIFYTHIPLKGDSRGSLPKIMAGGYWDSRITSKDGGKITVLAYAPDSGNSHIVRLEFVYQGIRTRSYLYDDGKNGDSIAGDGFFTLSGTVFAGMERSNYLFSLVAETEENFYSDIYPFLTVH